MQEICRTLKTKLLNQPEKKMQFSGKVGRAYFSKVRVSSELQSQQSDTRPWEQKLPWVLFSLHEEAEWDIQAGLKSILFQGSFILVWTLLSLSAKEAGFEAFLWSFSDFFPSCSFPYLTFSFRKKEICSSHSRVTLQDLALQGVYRYHLWSICDLGEFLEWHDWVKGTNIFALNKLSLILQIIQNNANS